MERLSVDEKERSQPGEGRPFNVSSSLSSPFEGWSDQEGGDRNGVSPYSQAFNAITTRWFSADLANATAVQAVHDEVYNLQQLRTIFSNKRSNTTHNTTVRKALIVIVMVMMVTIVLVKMIILHNIYQYI